MGLYYPVLGRFQHVASGHVSGERGTPASGERHAAGLHPPQQSSESAGQQHSGDPERDGKMQFDMVMENNSHKKFKNIKFVVMNICLVV